MHNIGWGVYIYIFYLIKKSFLETSIQSHCKNAQCYRNENDIPYIKFKGTKPKDDEAKTCMTKSYMLVDENEPFPSIYTLVHGTDYHT